MKKPRATVPVLPWGWRTMWVIAMFDLPTDTSVERRAYTQFRKALLCDGFTMMQFSVYTRHCASIENAQIHVERMGARVPSKGEVRFLIVTDKQFGRIRIYQGKGEKRHRHPLSNSNSSDWTTRKSSGYRRLTVGQCSKTRDGRIPQPAALYRLHGGECSKTRDGRNPQLPLRGFPPFL